MSKYKEEFGIVVLLDALGASEYDINQARKFLRCRDLIVGRGKILKADFGTYDILCLTTPRILQFADNLILALPINKDLQIDELFSMAQWLRESFCNFLYLGIPLRGVMTIGDYVTDQSNTIIGPAASSAGRWYEKADWAGIMISPECIHRIKKLLEKAGLSYARYAKWFVEYPVPLKDCKRNADLWAISWPYEFLSNSSGNEAGRIIHTYFHQDALVPCFPMCKYSNTMKFFEWYRDNIFTVELEREAREQRRRIWSDTYPIQTPGFIASKNSDVFHLLTCRWAAKIGEGNRVYFQTFQDAISSGRRPCGVCRPKED